MPACPVRAQRPPRSLAHASLSVVLQHAGVAVAGVPMLCAPEYILSRWDDILDVMCCYENSDLSEMLVEEMLPLLVRDRKL